ncbi:hypothetical protein CSB45_10710 [candidate division KSB3 bacterium]|uniref:FAD-binding domain-containing protein n=1 Tax=candidate division KSB3 bacterium TaxID=2044937 RepID=A0A2G6E3Q1_9BACT|nr:MAG: hypothetical protein CSB45_10710 [candidate division KSB3 bacterium]PIE29121.1 MAG: hypothetical protein CSA57_09915 [candidate division KSB3 bacterium]
MARSNRRRDQTDLVIIGSGPAGMSTALHVLKADPSWVERLLVLEKARHPREKLCGGGVTRLGTQVLADLGVSLETPQFSIREVRIFYQSRRFAIRDDPVFQVLERAKFDQGLCRHGETLGLRICQGEAVLDLFPHEDGIDVVTERGRIRTKAVIAADGSNSLTRKKLAFRSSGHKARLLRVLTPVSAHAEAAFQEGIATFDFSPMRNGVQGYYWDFPSVVGGRQRMNRGIFDSRIIGSVPKADLRQNFRKALQQRGYELEEISLKSFPISCFDPSGEFAKERVLLAGDAAGADPLFGEGISFALAYGKLAADTVLDAFREQNFCFQGYRRAILNDPILRQLHARRKIAELVYRVPAHPRLLEYFWSFVPVVFKGLSRYRPSYVPLRQPKLLKKF